MPSPPLAMTKLWFGNLPPGFEKADMSLLLLGVRGVSVGDMTDCHVMKEGSTSGRDPDFGRAQQAIELFAAGESIAYEVLFSTADRLDFNVTRCRYKQLMEELDALDLGPYLICDHDFAPALRAGMKLTRTQTCMQGASHCDFRFRLKDTQPKEKD